MARPIFHGNHDTGCHTLPMDGRFFQRRPDVCSLIRIGDELPFETSKEGEAVSA